MDLATAKKLIPSIQALHNAVQQNRGHPSTDQILQIADFLTSLLVVISQKTEIILEDIVSDLTSIPINVVCDTWRDVYRNSAMVKNIRKTMYYLEDIGMVKSDRKPVGIYGIKFAWRLDLPRFEQQCS